LVTIQKRVSDTKRGFEQAKCHKQEEEEAHSLKCVHVHCVSTTPVVVVKITELNRKEELNETKMCLCFWNQMFALRSTVLLALFHMFTNVSKIL